MQNRFPWAVASFCEGLPSHVKTSSLSVGTAPKQSFTPFHVLWRVLLGSSSHKSHHPPTLVAHAMLGPQILLLATVALFASAFAMPGMSNRRLSVRSIADCVVGLKGDPKAALLENASDPSLASEEAS